MSRKRKSRKPGALAPSFKPKSIVQEERSKQQKRVKKRKGLKPGHKQVAESPKTKAEKSGVSSKLAPEIAEQLGSKKPVALNVPSEPVETRVPETPKTAKQPVKVEAKEPEGAPSEQSLLAELEALEQDSRFNTLLDMVDKGEQLSAEAEAEFERFVSQHQKLAEALGLDDEEEELEDELWETLNQGDALSDEYKDEDPS
ncbi:GTPase-activating protein [Corallincola platygyrae]|uniref:GTPase-activating protein n=1 Tax=Corallincola platygyrae TaxID=1193278 RepID=A0ABW4XKC7_9GAMM